MAIKTPKIKKDLDKRRHERFPVAISMEMRGRSGSAGKCRGTISDLSMSGMTFKTNSEIEEGSVLCLRLDTGLEIRGDVRHIRSVAAGMNSYGVRFHYIGSQAGKPKKFISAKFEK